MNGSQRPAGARRLEPARERGQVERARRDRRGRARAAASCASATTVPASPPRTASTSSTASTAPRPRARSPAPASASPSFARSRRRTAARRRRGRAGRRRAAPLPSERIRNELLGRPHLRLVRWWSSSKNPPLEPVPPKQSGASSFLPLPRRRRATPRIRNGARRELAARRKRREAPYGRRSRSSERSGTTTSARAARNSSRGRLARRQLDLPAGAEAPSRQRERDRLGVRVEEEQERVVAHLLAVRRPRRDLGAVQEDAERPAVLLLPVALRHAPAVGAEPPHVGKPRAARLAAGEERVAPEHRMLAAQA